MSGSVPTDGRIDELLVVRAIEGLDGETEQELAQLTGYYDPEEFDAFERAAAALALNQLQPEALPGHVRERVERDARIWFSGRKGSNVRTLPTPSAPATSVEASRVSGAAGWWAAAAGLALAAVGLWRAEDFAKEAARLTAELSTARSEAAQLAEAVTERDARIASLAAAPAAQDPGERRARLLDDAKTGLWTWRATEDPAAGGASGDVVWNAERQEGYMRFVGLEPNTPETSTYQLWIFDETRDERFPVDGGVFDVPPGAGEVVVPFEPTLDVSRPVLFAVTVERPGGVMVSSRERIALVADPDA